MADDDDGPDVVVTELDEGVQPKGKEQDGARILPAPDWRLRKGACQVRFDAGKLICRRYDGGATGWKQIEDLSRSIAAGVAAKPPKQFHIEAEKELILPESAWIVQLWRQQRLTQFQSEQVQRPGEHGGAAAMHPEDGHDNG